MKVAGIDLGSHTTRLLILKNSQLISLNVITSVEMAGLEYRDPRTAQIRTRS